jgi:hypothetical protein
MLKDKEARARSIAFKDDWLAAAAVFKITAKIIPKDKASFTPRADGVHVQRLFQYEVRGKRKGSSGAESFDVRFLHL